MADPGMRINNTGAIGVYLVTGSTPAIRAGLGAGCTFTPLGTCESFPQFSGGNALAPVMSDWGGTAPIDWYLAGLTGQCSFVLNRFTWDNVVPLLNADPQPSANLTNDTLIGTTLFGRHGMRVGRNGDNAFGLLFVYTGTAGQLPSGADADGANTQVAGRIYHSCGLQNWSIATQGTRAFSLGMGFVAAQSIINNQIEMYHNLTLTTLPALVAPASHFASDFGSMTVYNTGPAGIYGAVQGGTYVPIGHCENFPQVTIRRQLDPITNDLFGDVPFDYTYGGQTVDVEMEFSRYDQYNLDTVIKGNYAPSLLKGQLPISGAVGGIASSQGSSIRIWWPSSSRPSTSNALTFKYGAVEADVVTRAGSRAMKNLITFRSSTVQETTDTVCQMVQFVLGTPAGPTCSDFSAV